jgi:hypothetical protein
MLIIYVCTCWSLFEMEILLCYFWQNLPCDMKKTSLSFSLWCSSSSSCQTVLVSMYSEITMFCICTHICTVNIFISQVSCLMPFASLLPQWLGSNTSFLSFLFHYSLYVTIPHSSSHLFLSKTGNNLLFLKAITIGSNFSVSISDSILTPLHPYKFNLWLMGINQAITDFKWF